MRTLEEKIRVQSKQIDIYKAHIDRFESDKAKDIEGEDVIGSIGITSSPLRSTQRKSLTPRQPRPVQKDMFFSFKDGSDVAKSTM